MTAHAPLGPDVKPKVPRKARGTSPARLALGKGFGPEQRAKLSARLRRVLSDHPRARHFTVHRIIGALKAESGASLALFSAAGVFETPYATPVAGPLASVIGAGMALGKRTVAIPRRILKKKIPRNSLSILVQGICSILDASEGATRERWSWVFHPAMGVALGLTLFLLGIASMAPIVGGGAQHAASAFLIAVGLAERDGLAVMIGAIAGVAAIALAALTIVSGSRLWIKVRAWLVQCARRLHLSALAALLDRCCHGLGELLRLKWGGLLLLILTPADPPPPRKPLDGSGRRLSKRARSVILGAPRASKASFS